MDAVLRGVIVYAFLLLFFRFIGKRSLSQITTFDFVLLLIIGEATQQALLGDDFSIVNALLVIVTLMIIDIGLSLVKQRSSKVEKLIDGVPTILVENGQPIDEHMQKARIDREDILESARELQGLERMEQIKYAVLERDGKISIIPA
ncbi:MAG TPA: YetF domain-containing protein [Oceanobacillus sp.]|nr:YetF domain-containing protein [Oceanobacillus sp.]